MIQFDEKKGVLTANFTLKNLLSRFRILCLFFSFFLKIVEKKVMLPRYRFEQKSRNLKNFVKNTEKISILAKIDNFSMLLMILNLPKIVKKGPFWLVFCLFLEFFGVFCSKFCQNMCFLEFFCVFCSKLKSPLAC